MLRFEPGTTALKCQHCGTGNEILSGTEPVVIVEIDFEKFLSESNLDATLKTQVHTVKCNSCGASSSLRPDVTSDNCPFCDTPLVISNANTNSIIKPQYLLPFSIDNKKANNRFREWVNNIWFAPDDFKKAANNPYKLNGMYIPYWTYDSQTSSTYTGMRGLNRTESYTAIVNGKSIRQTRLVVDWHPCSGSVKNNFDDMLVLASNSLPENYANALEPWDLKSITGYNEKFLSGFRTETYQLDCKRGFDVAKIRMNEHIRNAVCAAIGGNQQRISSLNVQYDNITFKHILLPIWISTYRYNKKVYRFMINGRTGEVQGERPYSWIKITIAILIVIAAIAGLYLMSN